MMVKSLNQNFVYINYKQQPKKINIKQVQSTVKFWPTIYERLC